MKHHILWICVIMFCADVIITTRESLSASLPSSVSSLIEFRRLHLLSCFDLCFFFRMPRRVTTWMIATKTLCRATTLATKTSELDLLRHVPFTTGATLHNRKPTLTFHYIASWFEWIACDAAAADMLHSRSWVNMLSVMCLLLITARNFAAGESCDYCFSSSADWGLWIKQTIAVHTTLIVALI